MLKCYLFEDGDIILTGDEVYITEEAYKWEPVSPQMHGIRYEANGMHIMRRKIIEEIE